LPPVISQPVAELIAIGAAIASNCEPCFKYHFAEARKLGVSDADMRIAVDIAQKVKDAPARKVLELATRMLEPARPLTRQAGGYAPPESAQKAAAPAPTPGQTNSGCCGTGSEAAQRPRQ
jgi:AhpD family alkylhydroperoxidase